MTRAVFRRHHYRTLIEDDGTVHLYLDRNRWAPWSGLVAHAAVVVILAGAMIGSMYGFRDGQFMLTEGSTSAIPKAEQGATITLNSFKDTYSPTTGQPLDYVSDISVMQDGKEVARQLVRVDEPLRYAGVSYFQAFFGPAAIVSVKDVDGKVLFADGVPLAWESSNGGNRMAASPSRTRTSPSGSSPRPSRTTRASSRARSPSSSTRPTPATPSSRSRSTRASRRRSRA